MYFILLWGLSHWNCAIDNTTGQKFEVKGCFMFLKEDLFDQKYSKTFEILL